MDCEASVHNLLERIVVDESIEPTGLPLAFLKAITNNFSDNQQIGKGGFAVVYKGQLQSGTVAVKRLSPELDMDEKNFNHEISSLIKVQHKNIVRFLGYCSDTQGKVEKYEGKTVMADVRQRLLCFEFLPNGSLDQYITDASRGLEWRIRYQIIKGICEGLHYLHQNKIVHLDLKPANILLTYNMVPKIADFGLSRCFDENQTHAITSKLVGSLGYLAPEFYSGLITFKLDIYSLGVIIMEILTGKKGYSEIEDVLEGWSNRFGTLNRDRELNQVRVCAKIGVECSDFNPAKRPVTQHIIEQLYEMEQTYGFIGTGLCTSSITHAQIGSSSSDTGSRQSGTAGIGDQGMFSSHQAASVPVGLYAVHRENVFPERPDQPECQYYMRTGDCGFGSVCKFHHPRERISPLGLPLRPGEQICSFYNRYGMCKFGPNCKYDHPMGSALLYDHASSPTSEAPTFPRMPAHVPSHPEASHDSGSG